MSCIDDMRLVLATAWVILCISSAPPCLPASVGQGEVSGAVLDAAELPVAEARIRLMRHSAGLVAEVKTRDTGEFLFPGLAPGAYELSVEKEGFRAFRHREIEVRIGERTQIRMRLEVGAVSEMIEVRGQSPLLVVDGGVKAYQVEQRSVVNLPLDGRNFVPLIALAPGVSLPPGSVLPRINGSRPRVSEYIYDGISVLQPEPGQVAFYPVIDAIAEFRVETSTYSAEYGRSNGGVILVQHRSGSNELHGTLFEFFRNEALNARNLFATRGEKPRFRRNQYGLVLGGPVVRDRTFFFTDWQRSTLGTGIVRASTVPLTEERGGRFRTAIFDPATTTSVGAAWQRQPFPGRTLPASRFDPAAAALMARFPAPNVMSGAGEAIANNFVRTGTDRTQQDQLGGRLDHFFGNSHRVFSRYSFLRDRSIPISPLPDGSGAILSGVTGDTLTRAASVAAEHTWTLSPVAVNQLRFGDTRRGFDRRSLRLGQTAGVITGIPGLPEFAFREVLPSFDLIGYQQLGPPQNGNAEFTTSVTQVADTLSLIHGAHSLRLGGDLRLQRLDVLQPSNPTGRFQFSPVLTSGLSATGTPVAGTGATVASFLLGQVQAFSSDLQREILQPRATIAELFLQDDWRMSERFIFSAGLRYTLNFPSTEAGNRAAVFNLGTEQLDFLGRDGQSRAARNLERVNFGPRLGMAWRPVEALVLRAGYGLTWIEQAGITTPFTTPLFPFIRTEEQNSLDNRSPAFVLANGPNTGTEAPSPRSGLGQGVFAVQRDQKSGYAQQWNLTIQRTIRSAWVVEAGYAGSKLTNLGVPDVNLNQLRVEQLALGAALIQSVANPYFGHIPAGSSLGGPTIARQQLLRPYPRFTTVALYRNNVGHSTYHALQTRLERRSGRGLTLTAAYTFSRLIDDAGAVFDSAILTGPVMTFQAADSHNRRLEKDVSTGNIPHVFSAGFVYELPFGQGRAWPLAAWLNRIAAGWQLAGLARVQSGSPIAVTQAPNLNAFAGFGSQRPNRLRDPQLPAGERSVARYFDTSAFSAAPHPPILP
jgi:hypothetical protein